MKKSRGKLSKGVLLQQDNTRVPGYAPFNAENSLSVTFGFIIAYAHEIIHILVSVLNIIFFLFYDVNLNTCDFVYLEFVKDQLGLRRNMPVFAKCNVYICFIYRHVQTLFQYQNQLFIFPIVG